MSRDKVPHPVMHPLKWDFYYTNMGFTSTSFKNLKMKLENIYSREMQIYVSDKWEYKSIIVELSDMSQIDCIASPDRVNWDNAVLFNFTADELRPVESYAKIVMSNFFDESNLLCAYTTGKQSMSEFLDVESTVWCFPDNDFINTYVTPIELATSVDIDSPLYLRNAGENPFGSVALFENVKSYGIASLKRVFIQIFSQSKIAVC